MKQVLGTLLILALIGAGAFGAYTLFNKANKKADTAQQTSQSQQQIAEQVGSDNQSSSEPTSSQSAVDKVSIKNFVFSPANITIKKGTTVTWTNNDGAPHTVAAASDAPEKFDSGNLSSNKTFSFTFSTTGTYKYHCGIHPDMTGTVTVTE
jgi:plastocyanin